MIQYESNNEQECTICKRKYLVTDIPYLFDDKEQEYLCSYCKGVVKDKGGSEMSLQKSQERLRNQTKQLYDALDSISTPVHEQDPQEVIKSIFNAKLRGVGKGREEKRMMIFESLL